MQYDSRVYLYNLFDLSLRVLKQVLAVYFTGFSLIFKSTNTFFSLSSKITKFWVYSPTFSTHVYDMQGNIITRAYSFRCTDRTYSLFNWQLFVSSRGQPRI